MSHRILLVDDHEVVRAGLRALIDSQEDMTVVGEASTAEEGVRRVGYDEPDVVILDVRLPDKSGVEACREMKERFPDVSVLMLTETLFQRIRGGAQTDPLLDRLTNQERVIVEHIAHGLTNKQIAEEMFLAEKTVKNYVSNVLAKMGMSRRSEAAAYVARSEAAKAGQDPPESWD
jgi:two-component system response regulator DevR